MGHSVRTDRIAGRSPAAQIYAHIPYCVLPYAGITRVK